MDETNIELKLNDHEHEIGSLKHRMKAVEENQKALNSLATSVAVVAEKTDAISNKVDSIDSKVSAIEQKPGKRWDGIVQADGRRETVRQVHQHEQHLHRNLRRDARRRVQASTTMRFPSATPSHR